MKTLTYISADEAVKGVRSGDHIHLSSIASVPHVLIDALCRRAGELRDLHFHHFHTEGPAPYGSKEYEGIFFDQGFFVGPNVRKSVQEGYADYLPTHLFESQFMYRSGALRCDVAMVQVSEPVDGMVSLGTSVDCSVAALEVARLKLAVVNPNVPFSYGEPIPVDRFDALVWDDTPLITKDYVAPSEIDRLIGRNCSELVPDGACLQMGIGSLPNALCSELADHQHLGLHTEMFADGALGLIRKGVIDGSAKKIDTGKVVASFLLGSQSVYDYIDRNPSVLMKDIAYTNDPWIIAQNPNFVSGVRRFHRHAHLLRHRRTAGLRPRRQDVQGRQGHHRPRLPHGQDDAEDRSHPQARRRRRHAPRRRPVGRHRIRFREPVRQIPAGKGPSAHLHRPSGRQRTVRPSRFRTVRSTLEFLDSFASLGMTVPAT